MKCRFKYNYFNVRRTLLSDPRSNIWAASSEFVSSSIPSWQILTAHVQPFRGARDLVVCLKVLLDSLLLWASSEGSGETARMRRLAWTFAARIGYKYQIRLTRSIYTSLFQSIIEQKHDKTNKMSCVPSEDSDQPGHPSSLIIVFAVLSMGSQGPKASTSGQRRLWLDWVDSHAAAQFSFQNKLLICQFL